MNTEFIIFITNIIIFNTKLIHFNTNLDGIDHREVVIATFKHLKKRKKTQSASSEDAPENHIVGGLLMRLVRK